MLTSHRFDYVFHYAALVGVKRTLANPSMVLEDLQGIKNILTLSKNTGVKRVFYSSSSEVYGEPVHLPQHEETTPLNSRLPYAIVKNAGEAFCKAFKQEFNLDKYIVLFPFCSAHLTHKKWPHYNELIELIKNKYGDQIKVVVAPGPSEIDDAKNINAVSIIDKDKALDISQLASLIKESSFVIANDTGPAHISAHLGVKGLTLFGAHTTAFKVSIERENFKAIQVADLEKLSASKVLEKILI